MMDNKSFGQEQKMVPVPPTPPPVALSASKFDYATQEKLHGPLRPERGLPFRAPANRRKPCETPNT